MEEGKKKEIVVGVTGSIAAFKAAELVSQLTRKNFRVTVVMTKAAQKFIRPLTFQALSKEPVITDLFSTKKNLDVNHISLAQRASLIIIAPASANIIGKMAGGMADDFLSTLIISASSPVLICPAMNRHMYKNSLVRENIKKLKKDGFHFLGPGKGRLACGDEGLGRLIEVGKIVSEVFKILKIPV
ncbi:MAG: flavoprotein [Candidatus Ratteibacteria bacterium]|nr:flavoprotein [Candidatus Ratteibacteria bacterium]